MTFCCCCQSWLWVVLWICRWRHPALLGEQGNQVWAYFSRWQENRSLMLLLELKCPLMQNYTAESPIMLSWRGFHWKSGCIVERRAEPGDANFIAQVAELGRHQSQGLLADQKSGRTSWTRHRNWILPLNIQIKGCVVESPHNSRLWGNQKGLDVYLNFSSL